MSWWWIQRMNGPVIDVDWQFWGPAILARGILRVYPSPPHGSSDLYQWHHGRWVWVARG